MAGELQRDDVKLDTRREVPVYGADNTGTMFARVIFRCPACGTIGEADSWCYGHSAPMECVGESLRVRREPVLIPHAEPERTVTETYRRPDHDLKEER